MGKGKGLSTSKINKRAIGNTLNYLGYEINSTDKRIEGHKFKAWFPLIILPINDINNIFSKLETTKINPNNTLNIFTEEKNGEKENFQSLHAKNRENAKGTDENTLSTTYRDNQSLHDSSFCENNEKIEKNEEEEIKKLYKKKENEEKRTDINESQSGIDFNQSPQEKSTFLHEGTEKVEKPYKNLYLKYFKTSEYYTKESFDDMGMTLIDAFDFENEHYYKLQFLKEFKGESAFKFSSYFSTKAIPITQEEFESKKLKGGQGNDK